MRSRRRCGSGGRRVRSRGRYGSGGRRRRRSKSSRRYDRDADRKKKHGKSAMAGTLMGIGGLTALLDGLGGL